MSSPTSDVRLLGSANRSIAMSAGASPNILVIPVINYLGLLVIPQRQLRPIGHTRRSSSRRAAQSTDQELSGIR